MSGGHVTERKRRLDGSTTDYDCERLLLEPAKRAVLRYVVPRALAFEGTGVVVPAGAVTVGHYWADRAYNVYHWIADGRTIAYYCNVSEPPRIAEGLVEYRDLAVDVLLDPAGTPTVLDEDELPDDLPSPLRALVSRAVEELTAGGRRLVTEVDRESRRLLEGA